MSLAINDCSEYIAIMASLTIRKLDDQIKQLLRVRAAMVGRSMEEEARAIITGAVGGMTGPELLATVDEVFGRERGVDLSLPVRGWGRPPADFTE